MSLRATSTSAVAPGVKEASPPTLALQRKCDCGSGQSVGLDEHCGACRGYDAGVRLQRKTVGDGPPAVDAPAGLVVDDDALSTTTGQMRKTQLLMALREASCAAADRALAEVGRSTQGCPHVDRWISYYSGRDAAHVERAIRRLVPAARHAVHAREYVPLVAHRMAEGAATWARTGRLPSDIPAEARLAALGGVGGGLATVVAGIGGLFAKGRGADGVDLQALEHRLGPGTALDGTTRSRMEHAFGASFGDVRVHADDGAGTLSRDLDARAFALGRHVAFAPGQYRPGTIFGDALLAHELAHVQQQRGADASDVAHADADGPGPAAHEREADAAAAEVVGVLHGGAQPKGWAGRLTSAPGLRRCGPSVTQVARPRGGARLSDASVDQMLREEPLVWPRIRDRVERGITVAGRTRDLDTEDYLRAAYDEEYEGFTNARTGQEWEELDAYFEMRDVSGFLSSSNSEQPIVLHRPQERRDFLHYRSLGGGGGGRSIPVPPSDALTVLHEAIHLYSSDAFKDLMGRGRRGRSLGNEGVTEYFTRLVLSHQESLPPRQGSYDDEVRAAECLADEVGRETLADAYFLGDAAALQALRDLDGFDTWTTEMRRGNVAAARRALGCDD